MDIQLDKQQKAVSVSDFRSQTLSSIFSKIKSFLFAKIENPNKRRNVLDIYEDFQLGFPDNIPEDFED